MQLVTRMVLDENNPVADAVQRLRALADRIERAPHFFRAGEENALEGNDWTRGFFAVHDGKEFSYTATPDTPVEACRAALDALEYAFDEHAEDAREGLSPEYDWGDLANLLRDAIGPSLSPSALVGFREFLECAESLCKRADGQVVHRGDLHRLQDLVRRYKRE